MHMHPLLKSYINGLCVHNSLHILRKSAKVCLCLCVVFVFSVVTILYLHVQSCVIKAGKPFYFPNK